MSNVSLDAVTSVIGKIYEAAYDQEGWFDAINSLRDLFGGSRSCIVRMNPQTADVVSTEDDPELLSQQCFEALMRDPLAAAAAALPVGKVTHWPMLLDEVAFRRREFWQDWFRPRDMYQGLVCNLLTANGTQWVLDIHRSSKQELFGVDDMGLLQQIAPHMLRVGQIGQQLGKMAAMASAFSHLPFGVFLVNGYQKLAQMNEAAEAMLMRPDSPLRLSGGMLVAATSEDTQNLQRLVVEACTLRNGVMPGTGGALLVPSHRQRPGLARLVLSVAPFVDARLYGLASERRAMIMVTEVARRTTEGFERHLCGLFDLTPSEARLAAALASGRSLKEIADGLGITVKTGRTYLERIFAKTRTHQQSELVALLKSTEPLSGRGR